MESSPESVCVFGVALSSLGSLSARMLIGIPALFLSLLEQSTALFFLGTQSNTEICPILLDIESRAAP